MCTGHRVTRRASPLLRVSTPRCSGLRAGGSLCLPGSGPRGGWSRLGPPCRSSLRPPVEVVAVQVGEHTRSRGGEVFDLYCRVRSAFACAEAVAEVNVVAGVEEVRVGQDSETTIADDPRSPSRRRRPKPCRDLPSSLSSASTRSSPKNTPPLSPSSSPTFTNMPAFQSVRAQRNPP